MVATLQAPVIEVDGSVLTFDPADVENFKFLTSMDPQTGRRSMSLTANFKDGIAPAWVNK